jgi:hypothetical protein
MSLEKIPFVTILECYWTGEHGQKIDKVELLNISS